MLTKQDLKNIGDLMDTKLEEKLSPIHTNIKKLRKDLTTTINFFDNRNLELQNDLKKVRKDVGLPEFNFA